MRMHFFIAASIASIIHAAAPLPASAGAKPAQSGQTAVAVDRLAIARRVSRVDQVQINPQPLPPRVVARRGVASN